MKIHKYRAWDKRAKTICFPTQIDFEQPAIFFPNLSNEGEYIKLEDFVLMQFTGLKDKHGKEIYEGDIVETDTFIDFPCVVGWWEDELSYWLYDLEDSDMVWVNVNQDWYRDGLEVIGNIYENETLLKK